MHRHFSPSVPDLTSFFDRASIRIRGSIRRTKEPEDETRNLNPFKNWKEKRASRNKPPLHGKSENKTNEGESVLKKHTVQNEQATEIQRLQNENTDLAIKLQSFQKDYTNMTNNVQRLQNQMRRLQQENVRLTANGQRLQDEKLKAEEKNIAMTAETRRLQNEKTDLITGMQRLKEENDQTDLEAINMILLEDRYQLQQEKTDLTNVNQQLRNENIRKNNEIQQYLNDSRKKCNDILQLRSEKDQLEKEKQQLHEETNLVQNRKQQLCLEHCEMEWQIQQLREEKNDMEHQNRQLREENTQQNYEIQEHEENNSKLSDEIRQLRQGNNNMAIEIERGTVTFSTNDGLGKGSWASVYKGDFFGTKVAVKQYHDIILSQHNQEILQREINIASQCRHPNLLQMICATRNERNCLLIVTELMDTSLRKLVEQRSKEKSQLEPSQIKSISLDVARGLNYLHSKTPDPIIHRDVSSANVLLWMENGSVSRAKLSDYGSANFMEDCNTPCPGAALYAAPEARGARHRPMIDVFSYGLLVCEMCICELPNQDKRRDQIERTNKTFKVLVEACTRENPGARPRMMDVIAFWKRA